MDTDIFAEQIRLVATLIENQSNPQAWCEQHEISEDMILGVAARISRVTALGIIVNNDATSALESLFCVAFSLGHDFALARMGERVTG